MTINATDIRKTSNIYLNGNYAPVYEERDYSSRANDGTDRLLEIEGEIPRELTGSYWRVGANPIHIQDPDRYHWFDGDGMIHALSFEKGEVRYRNRLVETRGLKKEREAGRALWGGANIPPDLSNPDGPYKNAANTALLVHDNEVFACWEGGPPHVMRAPSIETVGMKDYDGQLAHAFSAHSKVDGRTGELITFGHSPMGERPIGVSFISPTGQLTKTTTVKMKKPVFIHDTAITENYFLILDLPLTFDIGRLQAGGQMLDWEPENGSRIGVLPRNGDGDEVRWFDIDNCFVFHTVSAWEEADRVFLTACRMERAILLGSTADNEDTTPHKNHTLVQWELDLSTGSVTETELYAMGGDFPRINDALMAHKHQYAYKVYTAHSSIDFSGVAKMDLSTGEVETYDFGPRCRVSEFVFVERPRATAEDDGWIISLAYDEEQQQSWGVILDAQNVASGPIARIKIPARVPYGFHAAWIPASAYSS